MKTPNRKAQFLRRVARRKKVAEDHFLVDLPFYPRNAGFRETGEHCRTGCGTDPEVTPQPSGFRGPASEDSAGSRMRRFYQDAAGPFRRHGQVPRILLVRRISGRERGWHPTARRRESARQEIRHISRSTYKRSGLEATVSWWHGGRRRSPISRATTPIRARRVATVKARQDHRQVHPSAKPRPPPYGGWDAPTKR